MLDYEYGYEYDSVTSVTESVTGCDSIVDCSDSLQSAILLSTLFQFHGWESLV